MKQRYTRRTDSSAGFTLIELMTVVLIVSILVAIAVPTYQNQIRKGRRNDARTALLDLAGREERYYAASNTYTISPIQLGYVAVGGTGTFPQTVGSGYYQITVAAGTPGIATSFLGSVTPVTGSPQLKDTSCQYFSIDNLGNQLGGTSSSTAVTSSPCWQ